MRRSLVVLALGSAVALAAAGCTADDGSAPSAGPNPDASTTVTPTESAEPPPSPRAGACYRLTLQDAARPTNDKQPVRCSARHTAVTIHVGRLDLVDEGRSLAVDDRRVQQQVADRCPRELDKFVGGDAQRRQLSRFQVVWFSPTLEEAAAGAEWFRCDLIAFGRADQLQPLPPERMLRGVLSRPDGLATFGLCGTAKPGSRSFERVACGLPHSWRAVSTIPIPGGRAYPGGAQARQASDEECADLVRSLSGLPLEFSYGLEWPTRAQWDAGQRHGLCWAPRLTG